MRKPDLCFSEHSLSLQSDVGSYRWIEPDVLAEAIVTMVSLKSVFGLPDRALFRFFESILDRLKTAFSKEVASRQMNRQANKLKV